MTLGEFKKQTEGYPDSIELFIGERLSDFRYGLVNSVVKKKINFSEEPDSNRLATEEVIVLSDY